jgi:hypothetical protein
MDELDLDAAHARIQDPLYADFSPEDAKAALGHIKRYWELGLEWEDEIERIASALPDASVDDIQSAIEARQKEADSAFFRRELVLWYALKAEAVSNIYFH